MYTIRHPEFNLLNVLEVIVNTDFEKAEKMSSYLKGRCLWCIATCSESLFLPNEQTTTLMNNIVDFSIKTLKTEEDRSVQLVATRSLVRFSRKMKKEDIEQNSANFESILDDLLKLLDGSNKEVMHLPIQAF